MTSTPVSAPNMADPGDDVSRRFRYQHAYGVILWAAGFRKQVDHVALWCEQHEDFLGQVGDSLFDAYQIKTREAEYGYWDFSDKPLCDSLARFVKLDELYPGQIRRFFFVSNAQWSESAKPERQHVCPALVLKACVGESPLPDYCQKALKLLAEKSGCTEDALLTVLKRTAFQAGPSLSDVDAVVVHQHLAVVEGLASCSGTELTLLYERLLGRVRDASSLASRDPARHYPIINRSLSQDAQLLNKRIAISELTSHLEYLRLLSAHEQIRAQPLSSAVRLDASGVSPMTRLISRYKTETENDQKVKRLAKAVFRQKHDRLFCQVCEFDFGRTYGDPDFIEVHHLIPLCDLKPGHKTKLSELAMVCPNCHRMLHRGSPWPTIEELRKTISR